jgi:hypothetical protein
VGFRPRPRKLCAQDIKGRRRFLITDIEQVRNKKKPFNLR